MVQWRLVSTEEERQSPGGMSFANLLLWTDLPAHMLDWCSTGALLSGTGTPLLG